MQLEAGGGLAEVTVAGRKSASPPLCRELPKVSLGSIAVPQCTGVLSEGRGVLEGMGRERAGRIPGNGWQLFTKFNVPVAQRLQGAQKRSDLPLSKERRRKKEVNTHVCIECKCGND